jgi:hypothetical protein
LLELFRGFAPVDAHSIEFDWSMLRGKLAGGLAP